MTGADLRCEACHGEGLIVERAGERARARQCTCVGACSRCGGSGFVATSAAFRAPLQRCACRDALTRVDGFNHAGIPARHADSTRATFKPYNRATAAVLGVVSAYVRDFLPSHENRGLVLYGDVGRGKTHLMVAIVRDLILRHRITARFVEFSHLLADLKAGFDAGQGSSTLIDPLVEVDVLAIDELGKGRCTEFELTVVDEIVSRRYNAARPILATTNYGPGPAGGKPVANVAELDRDGHVMALPTLADRVGERVYSRLRETCDFAQVRGKDHREERRGR